MPGTTFPRILFPLWLANGRQVNDEVIPLEAVAACCVGR